MAKSLEEARKKLDDEYGQVRRHLDKIHKALDAVDKAGPEDDLHDLLEKPRESGPSGSRGTTPVSKFS
jgi:hypothetical protein